MNEMVERVARAIAEEMTGGFPSAPKSIDHRAASAAIEIVQQAVIDHIATAAENIGHLAGVGGCETAGLIISVLSRHPEMTAEFMETGSIVPSDPDVRFDWSRGRLTFHSKNGEIVSPQKLHAAVEIQKLKQASKATPSDRAG